MTAKFANDGIAGCPDRMQPTLAWWHGWLPLLLLPAGVLWLVPADWPPWACMWTLTVAIYAGFKWLTWRRTPAPDAPLWKHLAYLFAWPGMDAAAGLRSSNVIQTPSMREAMVAGGKFTLGLVLLFGGLRWVSGEIPPYLTGWLGMVGIVLTLHFGLFQLLSCGWRLLGMDARPLMDRPLASTSVSDFWGRRWNTAFRDLTHRFLFRPLTARLGPRGAIWAGFLFSGLIHDLVISLPAQGGYGGPTAFFVLQGAAMFLERSTPSRRLGLGRGWRGWLFTACVLLGPAPALFHPPFVERVILPFLKALGAM